MIPQSGSQPVYAPLAACKLRLQAALSRLHNPLVGCISQQMSIVFLQPLTVKLHATARGFVATQLTPLPLDLSQAFLDDPKLRLELVLSVELAQCEPLKNGDHYRQLVSFLS